MKGVNFDGSSLVGSRIGCCPLASFKAADLRSADLRDGEFTACDFSAARLDNTMFDGATYDATRPPIGLPDELLRICKAVPSNEPVGAGAAEYPVPIHASLTALDVLR
jgi:hypothetical protein